ncbi:unnamed protein product, partial [Larinioides sclopetarius]
MVKNIMYENLLRDSTKPQLRGRGVKNIYYIFSQLLTFFFCFIDNHPLYQ